MSQDNSHRPQPLRSLDGSPVFEQEWQAQILAMVDALVVNKSIAPASWSENFGLGLKNAHAEGKPDDLGTYYSVALETLEMLVTKQCKVTQTELSNTQQAWKQAYLDTPHGQPVNLHTDENGGA